MKRILILLIVLLLILNVFSLFAFWQKQKDYNTLEQASSQKLKWTNFLDLFIDTVLDPEQEMTIEDRLDLENAVRNLENQEIKLKWQNFANASNEIEAQRTAVEVLKMLVNQIGKS